MTTKTRYFVIVSLLVAGRRPGNRTRRVLRRRFPPAHSDAAAGRTSSASCPRDAVGHRLRERPRSHGLGAAAEAARALPMQENGQQELQDQTGINLETDIDTRRGVHAPGRPAARAARRRHGAGARPLRRSEDRVADARARRARRGLQGQAAHRRRRQRSRQGRHRRRSAARAHTPASPSRSSNPASPRSAARRSIKSAIDLHKAGNNPQAGLESVTGNDELMNAGALARRRQQRVGGRPLRRAAQRKRTSPGERRQPDSRDHLVRGQRSRQRRPPRHAPRRSARRRSRPTTCATSSAASWRSAKLQCGIAKPELQAMMQSLELGGTGKTVVALVHRAGRSVRRHRRDAAARASPEALSRDGHAATTPASRNRLSLPARRLS